MNQKSANRPLSNLLQTADSPGRIEQVIDGLPELIFRSPTFKETFGNTTFVILIIILGFSVVLVSGLVILAGYNSAALMICVLLGLVLVSFVLYFLLRTGRVVLKSDKLIEYNLLNYHRVFTYAQIFEVKRGAHADKTWIRYYSMDRNGRINYKSIRGRNLISVQREAELRRELGQRISAPPPILSQSASSMLIVLLLGVLVIPVVIIISYLLVVAVQR